MRGNLHSAIQYVATALALVATDTENEPRLSGARVLKGMLSIRHDKTPLIQMSPIISNVWMTA
jgi:hypothetical protein